MPIRNYAIKRDTKMSFWEGSYKVCPKPLASKIEGGDEDIYLPYWNDITVMAESFEESVDKILENYPGINITAIMLHPVQVWTKEKEVRREENEN